MTFPFPFICPRVVGAPPSSLSLIAQFGKDTGSTFTYPVGTQAGDLAVILDAPSQVGTTVPTANIPTGYTQIGTTETNAVTPACRADNSYKVLTSGDISAGSATGMLVSGSSNRAFMGIFRADNPINSVTVTGFQSQSTTGNPTLKNISSVAGPALIFGQTRASAAVSGATGTYLSAATEFTNIGTSHHGYYLIQNGSGTAYTWDIGDAGSWNILQSWALLIS